MAELETVSIVEPRGCLRSRFIIFLLYANRGCRGTRITDTCSRTPKTQYERGNTVTTRWDKSIEIATYTSPSRGTIYQRGYLLNLTFTRRTGNLILLLIGFRPPPPFRMYREN